MRYRLLAFALLFSASSAAAGAEAIVCPNLSAAMQRGSCPSEAELKYTFIGHCSDNARVYAKDTDECTDFQRYRRLKNNALWESGDGAFQGYLSCDLPPATIKSLAATAISVAKQNKLTLLTCTYPQGITFVHRTRAQCTVDAGGQCSTSGAACSARCE